MVIGLLLKLEMHDVTVYLVLMEDNGCLEHLNDRRILEDIN